MKKFLPIILLLVGVIVVGVAFFFVRRARQTGDEDLEDESALIEVPLEKRPIASLTPSEDGHYLFMKIEKIMVAGAESMDYELLYRVKDGGTQGVPGTIKLTDQTEIERELLLGSESSGKFRYDEGVEQGTLTLRFRNERGKLMAKFSTDFRLLSDTKDLSSVDGKFSYEFDKTPKEGFFIVMETFGVPEAVVGQLISGPYGIFSSSESKNSGMVEMEGVVSRWDGSEWRESSGGKVDNTGIFIGTPST